MYINRGHFTTVHKTQFPYIAFNNSPSFDSLGVLFKLTTNDTLILTVINNDSVVHGFDVKNYAGFTATNINPGNSITDTLIFQSQGIYLYYDSYQYPKYRYLGGAGMICINNSTTIKKFYWNIREHQSDYNVKLAANIPVDWGKYNPDYYTINGLSYPDLMDDTTNSWIHGPLGDTLHIAFANTGQSSHSMHLHGFHAKVIYSTNPSQVGRVKETFPLKSMDAIIIELVSDKKGFYSIHDHNLLTGTGAGMHMRGMLGIMKIE